MIGNAIFAVPHSKIGTLSALHVGMETQFANFDISSLLTSSDDQHASVLGQKNIKLPDEKNGQRFSDHFVEAAITVPAGSMSLDEADAVSAEIQNDTPSDIANDTLSFLSESFEVPNSPKNERPAGQILSGHLVTLEPKPENREIDSEQLTALPIRKSASANFDEWETDFAATATLSDNFSAVEAAIAKYTTRNEQVEQSQNEPASELKLSEFKDLSNLKTDYQGTVLGALNQRTASMVSGQVTKEQVAPKSDTNINANTTFALQSIQALEQENTLKFSAQLTVKPGSIDVGSNRQSNVGPKLAPVASLRTENTSLEVADQTNKSSFREGGTEETLNRSFDYQNRSSQPAVSPSELSSKLAEASQSNQPLNKTSLKADLVQPLSTETQPVEFPSAVATASPIEPNKPIRDNKLASHIKRVPELKVTSGLDEQGADGEYRLSRPTEIPSSTPHLETDKVRSDSKILGSLNLRLANKAKVDRPVIEVDQEIDTPFSETVDGKLSVTRGEIPIGTADKSVPIAASAHLMNLVTAPVSQKPVSFDWNSPQFAERFATEVSDLTINGDLKKFEINPRNLGRLEVALVARGSSEVLRIEAESQAARDVIVQHSQAIQDMLKSQGRPDVTIRVDVKDTGFASVSAGAGQNLAQQNEAGTQEDRSSSQYKGGSSLAADIRTEPEPMRDQGRYA